jgi:hypothetical protein
MPLVGMTGRSKRSKDGGSACRYDDNIYALKGGNTQEFWVYDPGTDEWAELDTMPSFGSTGRKKRVKYGADIASFGDGAFFALKGNKTLEFWRYVLPYVGSPEPVRSGVMGTAVKTRGMHGFELRPNPLASGFATVRYSLPKAGPVFVRVFDVAGRTVSDTRSLGHSVSGSLSLDLRNLSAGIYLVQLDADGYSDTRKLVIRQ